MTQIGAGASTRISLKAAENAGSQLTSPVFDPFPTESPTAGARRRNHYVIGDEQLTAAQHRRGGRSCESAASSRRRIDRTRRALGADLHNRPLTVGRSALGFPVGSSIRLRPAAHCCIRSTRAFRAHAGHTASRVDPQAIATVVSESVSRSSTRRSSASSLVVRAGFDHHPWP
jgi:hypothetical protein